MKNLKSGFTLAEVLITLAIIGIIAAIIMPAVITSYQCKSVGVKLAKFASTVENSARAYVVQNDSFKTTEKSATAGSTSTYDGSGRESINTFINESLIFKDILEPSDTSNFKKYGLLGKQSSATQLGIEGTSVTTGSGASATTTVQNLVGVMKDGTKVWLQPLAADTGAANWKSNTGTYAQKMKMISANKVGEGAFIIEFDPAVTGLSKDIQKTYTFVVTELGYMYPAADDTCLWKIYDEEYVTNSATFKVGSACLASTTTP